MTPELNKTYVTSDGTKFGPLEPGEQFGMGGPWLYKCDGEYFDKTGRSFTRRNDLVGEAWVSPIRTETVTTRRIEPGVYGRLWVEGDATGYVSIALTSIDGGGRVGGEFRRSLSAPELRELARVALELAEYLDAQ